MCNLIRLGSLWGRLVGLAVALAGLCGGLGGAAARAQAPDWAVDTARYEYTLTATVAVVHDGASVADSGDVLGAFVGDTVRGVARPDPSAGEGGLYFLTIYGNGAGQSLSLRVYDASENTVRTASRTLRFEPNATYGTPSSPVRLVTGEEEPPGAANWSVSPAAYEQTMTVTATVYVAPQERPSDGAADKVAALLNGEVRGVATSEPVGDRRVFFLTVYGNPPDAERPLTLRYYDAAQDRVYPTSSPSLSFQANDVQGTPAEPVAMVAERPSAQVEGTVTLEGIAPQPLDRDALVRFAADRDVRLRLALYDTMGRRVRVLFEGRVARNQVYRRWLRVQGLASGLYWLRLRGPRGAETRPVAVVR